MSRKQTLIVRKATLEDIGVLCELLFLLKSIYASCEETSLEDFKRRYEPGLQLALNSHTNAVWVAEEEGRVMGFLTTTWRPVLRLGGLVGTVEEIYVRPEARRRGIAVAMWRSAVEELHAVGASVVEIVSSLAHPGQRQFARKIGMEWYASIHRVVL